MEVLSGRRAEETEGAHLATTESNMTKRLLMLLLGSMLLSMVATACHTIHGAGEDISTTGNAIQESTPP
jgi:predicted small secreted protein